MKSYTNLEQSKILSKILSLESADMWYSYYGDPDYNPTTAYKGQQYFLCQIRNSLHGDIPCWSLAALLGVLPKGTNISTPKPTNALGYCCWNQYDEIYADNPVDACYEMILKLYELNLL